MFAVKSWFGKVSRLVRRQAPLFIGAAVLNVFILAGMGALDVYLRDLQVQEGQRTALNLTSIVADQTDRAIQSAWSVLSRIGDELHRDGVNSGASLQAAAAAADLRAILGAPASQDAFLQSVFILSADGKSLGRDPEPFSSLSGQYTEHFLDALRQADDKTVYVSAPFQSTISGTWQLSLSKRISAKDGGFLGAVTGVVKLASFQRLLEQVALGYYGSLSVFRDDGTIIACYPQRDIFLGSEIAASPIYTDFIAQKTGGVTRLKDPSDHVERLVAIAHSGTFPVASLVAVAMNDVLANWPRQVEILAVCTGVIVLAILFGVILLAVRVEQLADAREREALQAQMAEQYRQFQNATDNISQGLALYDRENVLIACNKRYAEIYGLPVDMTGPGLSAAKRRNLRSAKPFGRPIGEAFTEADGARLTIHEMPDGRFIAQRRKMLRSGGWVSTHEDITERRRAEDKIREMATTDALTGLSNRFDFRQCVESRLAEVGDKVGKFAMLYVDLDHFKSVNDSVGHTMGDKLLQAVAERIRAGVREGDAVARLGGDEFAIFQRLHNVPRDAVYLAERLTTSLAEPFSIDGERIESGASIGIALAPQDSADFEELLRDADMALHHAKAERGRHVFFKSWMDEQVRSRRQMQSDLRNALAEDQFSLFFQPVVSVADRSVKSFEALIRWNHPERGRVPPNEFIPLAEEDGLIVDIGEWVLQEACREASRWPEAIKVAVNVSALQFKVPGLLESVVNAVTASGIDSKRLIVEVTESVMIKNPEQAVATLHAMRRMGVSIAMDDFGTGYSSLNYLRRFPFDKIKIDRSFVSEISEREDSAAIVRAAVGLAKALRMETVAEGIETEEQMARVRLEGCALAQGFLISRPMPAEEVCGFLGVEPKPIVEPRAAPATALESKDGVFDPTARARGIAQFSLKSRDGKTLVASVPLVKATGT